MTDGSLDSYKLEWITSFLSVVDHGGFAAAAEHTFRSQSRISSHIADLERSLGTVLFDRKERPVRLTEAGMAFLSHARALLRELEAARSSVQAVLGVLQGRVRLGIYPSCGAAFVPELFIEAKKLFPHIAITLYERAIDELTDSLITGETDLVIRPMVPPVKEPSIQHYLLWEEPLVAVLPKQHPLAENEYLPLSDLANHPIIAIGPYRGEYEGQDEVTKAFLSRNVHPELAIRTNEPQTLMNLVKKGLGIGLTNLLAAETSDTSELTIVPILDSGTRRQVGLFWDSSRQIQPASRALLDLIVQMPVPQAVQRYQRRSY